MGMMRKTLAWKNGQLKMGIVPLGVTTFPIGLELYPRFLAILNEKKTPMSILCTCPPTFKFLIIFKNPINNDPGHRDWERIMTLIGIVDACVFLHQNIPKFHHPPRHRYQFVLQVGCIRIDDLFVCCKPTARFFRIPCKRGGVRG